VRRRYVIEWRSGTEIGPTISNPSTERMPVKMNVSFSDDELAILRRVVDEYLADLHEEAHHTDAHEYKVQLLREESRLKEIRQKLEAPAEREQRQ
jgi:hypothetical protein